MKLSPIVFSLIIFSLCEIGFSQDNTTQWSAVTAQSFIKRFPNPDTLFCCGNTNHFSWQAGYIMFAMEKMWNATGDPVYYNYIKRYVDQQVDEQGNVAPFKNTALDNFLPGYAILSMYEQTHLDKYKIAAKKIRTAFDTYPRNSNGLFWHGNWAKNQVWVDGLFMGQIFLARYGTTIGDSEYAYNEVVKQITLVAERCQKENGLLLHGWDESKKASWADPNTGLAQEVWSEGLGWYAVLLADVFDYLPKDHPGYPKVFAIHQKLCKGLKEVRDTKTGMWCQVVDKPNEPGNWNETSGTGMFMYLLKKSIDKGYISAAEYEQVVKTAYNGIITKAKTNDKGYIDLYECSSIGIQNDYQAYINMPKEISPYAAFGSFIIGTSAVEFASSNRTAAELTTPNRTAVGTNKAAAKSSASTHIVEMLVNGIALLSYCATPDGMAIAPDGSLLVACPNYGDQSKKACILNVDKKFNVSLLYEFAAYPPTGVVCPMGIDVDKNGNIYICDNQGWMGTPEGKFKGRILKLKVVNKKVREVIEVATGMEHPNGVKVSGNFVYVTQSVMSNVQDSTQLLTSGVYRFSINDTNIKVTNVRNDANLLVSFKTYNKFCQYGVDGLVFDSNRNLIVGNFGDGTLHKIIFDKNLNVSKVELLAKTDFDCTVDPKTKDFITIATKSKMRTTDGICIDASNNIYVADFSNNAIAKVSPAGKINVIVQYEDNDGSTGKLNQPGEPILWNGKLVVSNFDMVTGPDKVNTRHDPVATLSIFTLVDSKK